MTLVLIALWCSTAGALFEVESFPSPSSEATLFLAEADTDNVVDIFVLDGLRLTAYLSGEQGAPHVVRLSEGTTAFDVADLDGDGQNEIVAVCGARIQRYALRGGADSPGPAELFGLKDLLLPTVQAPVPSVLVIPYEGRTVLVLPTEEGFELRAPDGARVGAIPYRKAEKSPETNFFSHDPFGPRLTSRGALEKGLSGLENFEPDLPPELGYLEKLWPPMRGHDESEDMEAGTAAVESDGRTEEDDEELRSWPRFPLRKDSSSPRRVYYDSSFSEGTVVVLADPAPEDAGKTRPKFGPKRRYRGVRLSGGLPDFNNDGFVDLFLLNAQEPGMSVDSIARALTSQSWPVWYAVHLFSPKEDRYEPAPSAKVELRLPAMWFLMNRDMLGTVLRDFDGDGCSDFAWPTDELTFSAWLYKKGFPAKPDFTHTFPEPLEAVELWVDLDGKGRASIVLRGEKAFYLLRAVSP